MSEKNWALNISDGNQCDFKTLCQHQQPQKFICKIQTPKTKSRKFGEFIFKKEHQKPNIVDSLEENSESMASDKQC